MPGPQQQQRGVTESRVQAGVGQSSLAQDFGSNAANQRVTDPDVPQFFDPGETYPLGQAITWTSRGRERTVTELSGNDMNELARACYAETSGGLSGLSEEELESERRAMVSVILNRLGAAGVRGGRQDTIAGVLRAPHQFESVTGFDGGPSAKFADSTPGQAGDLPRAEQADIASCLRIAGDVVASPEGAPHDYTSNRAGTRGRGTVEGGSRFWRDNAIER